MQYRRHYSANYISRYIYISHAMRPLVVSEGAGRRISTLYYPRRNKSKYGAKKTTLDGITFDSKKEAIRYDELKWLEREGEISNIRRQVKYVLIPCQREPERIGARGGKIKGRLLEREVSYLADFVYYDNRNKCEVVEDVKGVRTPEYVIKRKLMLYMHNIRIKEI